jgi:glycosyltransferase involved in cell wall biosynthesis
MNVVPAVEKWLRRENVTPVAMSKHGAGCVRTERHRSGLHPPCAREALEADGDGRPVARTFRGHHPEREQGGVSVAEGVGENILAFALFAKTRPDALLYLHTEARPLGGIDLVALTQAAGIDSKQVIFADQYGHRMGVPDDIMAQIYSRTDVLLSASAGEGFGLPVLEAQACGTRVIVSNFRRSRSW